MLDRQTKRRLLQQFKSTNQLSYYKTLEVSKTDSLHEIKNAYYRLIKQSHPDRINKPDSNCNDCQECDICEIYTEIYGKKLQAAEYQSRILNEAWDVLQDEDKKYFYDEFLNNEVDRRDIGLDSDGLSDSEESFDSDDSELGRYHENFDFKRERCKFKKKLNFKKKMKKMEDRPDYEAFEVHERSWFYRWVVIPVVVYCVAYHWLVPDRIKYRFQGLL